jgi:hypothetical protein
MLELANQFANPFKMNDAVEFQCPNTRDGKLKKLYAWAPILSSRSEYFKTSKFYMELKANMQCLNQVFQRGLVLQGNQRQIATFQANPVP